MNVKQSLSSMEVNQNREQLNSKSHEIWFDCTNQSSVLKDITFKLESNEATATWKCMERDDEIVSHISSTGAISMNSAS